jgi:hypothetical protein
MKCILLSIYFVVGLALAGADGEMFPWINLAGVAIFSAIPITLWRSK